MNFSTTQFRFINDLAVYVCGTGKGLEVNVWDLPVLVN